MRNPPAFMTVCAQALSRVLLLATPWAVTTQVPLSMGFSMQEYCSGLSFPSLGALPDPGIEPMSLVSPALSGGIFTTTPPGKLKSFIANSHIHLFTYCPPLLHSHNRNHMNDNRVTHKCYSIYYLLFYEKVCRLLY